MIFLKLNYCVVGNEKRLIEVERDGINKKKKLPIKEKERERV